jgi:hypothetical protein
VAAALSQEGSSSTGASFLLITGCSLGFGCFHRWLGDAATFLQCSFVSNSIGAIGHNSASAQDVVRFCCFVDTNLKGSLFNSGSVLVDSCLFAGAVPAMPGSFIMTGAQIGYTSTGISFDTASLLPTCGGIAGLRKESPAGTGPYASSRLIVRMVLFSVFFALPL